MRLVLVHGIAQGGRNPKDIEVEWLASLNEGLSRSGLSLPKGVDVKLPFYGDELDRLVQEYDVPISGEIAAKGGEIPDDYALFREKVVEEIRRKAGISDEQAQVEMGSDVADKGVQNWKWVQALIRIIDRRVTGLSGWTIEEFLRCVYLYTQKNDARTRIDRIVSADFTDDSVVVGQFPRKRRRVQYPAKPFRAAALRDGWLAVGHSRCQTNAWPPQESGRRQRLVQRARSGRCGVPVPAGLKQFRRHASHRQSLQRCQLDRQPSWDRWLP
jgi:hypothetical protein